MKTLPYILFKSTIIVILPRCLEDYDRFILRYPFTREGKQRISKYILEDLLKDRDIVERSVNFVEHVLKRGSIPQEYLSDVETFLICTYLSILIVAQLDRKVWTRFADVLSKYMSDNLCLEIDRDCILYIAEEFGIYTRQVRDVVKCEKLNIFFDIAIPVWTYLKYRPKNDPNWKLTNRYLARGYVLLTYRELARLVEEAVEKQILNMIENSSKNDIICSSIREIIGDRLRKIEKMFIPRIEISKISGKVSEDQIFPPCIQAIISDIRSGGNPSHMARFTVASFLLNYYIKLLKVDINDAIEKVVDLFRTVADFDERKTRYQVQHIAGLVGGRKFYLPPNCDELQSLGLCPTGGSCGVKNPLVYTMRKLKEFKRARKEVNNTVNRKDVKDANINIAKT